MNALERMKRWPAVHALAVRTALDAGCIPEAVFNDRSLHPSVCRVRRRFVALLRWSSGLSSTDIGWLLGYDHTTILFHIRLYEQELALALAPVCPECGLPATHKPGCSGREVGEGGD